MTYTINNMQLTILLILTMWDLLWKGIALWKSSRRGEKAWFIALLVLNTGSILPIAYLAFKDMNSESHTSNNHRKSHDAVTL